MVSLPNIGSGGREQSPDVPGEKRARRGVGFLGRIVIALAIAGLVPVAVISFRLIDLNREALTQQVLQAHSLSANTGATEIENIVASWGTVCDALLASPDVQAGEATDAAKGAVRNLLLSRDDVAAIAITDSEGRSVFSGQRRSESSALDAIAGRRGAMQPVEMVTAGNRHWLALSRPLASGGTATVVFDAGAIERSLETSELGDEAIRVVLGRDRKIVAGRADLLRTVPPALLLLAVHGTVRGSGRFRTPGGPEIVGAYSPIGGTPWVMLSAQPATVAESVAASLRRRSLAAIAAALALVVGLSVAAWLIVVRPLHELLAAQTELGVNAGGGSDVVRLRKSIGILQKRVRERAALDRVFLGRFQVLETVGEGGMGTVFRGWDPKLQRPVALKTVNVSQEITPDERRRMVAALVREAVTIAQFQHPDIVSIYDVEEASDAAFIAMEYVDGTSLEHQLRVRGTLTPEETAGVGLAIASALRAAHAVGVIHRDIKPANVLISSDGTVKVTDFGISDFLSSTRGTDGGIRGTPGYMAPEVIRGKEVSPSSDLFATGVTLYRCATGVSPFRRSTPKGSLEATLRDTPVRPRTLVPAIAPALENVIMNLLAKNPEERMPSAEALVTALEKLSREMKIQVTKPAEPESAAAAAETPVVAQNAPTVFGDVTVEGNADES